MHVFHFRHHNAQVNSDNFTLQLMFQATITCTHGNASGTVTSTSFVGPTINALAGDAAQDCKF